MIYVEIRLNLNGLALHQKYKKDTNMKKLSAVALGTLVALGSLVLMLPSKKDNLLSGSTVIKATTALLKLVRNLKKTQALK